MATTITINSVNFPNAPAAPIAMTFEYKRADEPSSAYAVIASGVPVSPDGTINVSPLPFVSGLTPDTLYYVRQSNDCDSPRDYFIQPVQL